MFHIVFYGRDYYFGSSTEAKEYAEELFRIYGVIVGIEEVTMSQPYTCPQCGYHTEFGNSARISLHQTVSHSESSILSEAVLQIMV